MRLSTVAIASLLLGLGLVISACGEDRTTAAGGPAGTAPAGSASDTKPSPPPPPARSCQRQLGSFLASMATLRDELARGLSYDDYLARVKGTRGVYARIRADQVPVGCLVASGGPAERAFNLYIDAANAWGDCLATVSCDTRSIEPQLQRKWAVASNRLAIAQRGLSPARNG